MENYEIETYEDWLNTKEQNERLIKTNLIQIQMAKKILELCQDKLKNFEEKKQENKNI